MIIFGNQIIRSKYIRWPQEEAEEGEDSHVDECVLQVEEDSTGLPFIIPTLPWIIIQEASSVLN